MGYPHRKTALVVGVLSGLLWSGGTVEATTFTGIGDLIGGIFSSHASDVAANGATVTGWSETAVGAKAVSWNTIDGIVPLASLLGDDGTSHGYGVSALGNYITGSVGIGGVERAVRWDLDNQLVPVSLLGTLQGGTYSRAHSISADGTAVAGYGNSSGGWQAFRWIEGVGMAGLGWLNGAINLSRARGISADGDTVVGWSYSNGGFVTEAFRWTEASGVMIGLGDLPGGSVYSSAAAASANGAFIVGGSKSLSGPEAFIWNETDEMVGLGALLGGTFDSEALNVSDDGMLVVGTGTDDDGAQAFIWHESAGMMSVKDLLDLYEVDTTGWRLEEATSVTRTEGGVVIVGTGMNPDGDQEGWVAEVPAYPYVPEPMSCLLLGCVGVGLWRRRGV